MIELNKEFQHIKLNRRKRMTWSAFGKLKLIREYIIPVVIYATETYAGIDFLNANNTTKHGKSDTRN